MINRYNLYINYSQIMKKLYLIYFFNNNNEKKVDIFIELIKILCFYIDKLAILYLEVDEKYISQNIKKFEKSKSENYKIWLVNISI